MIALLMTLSCPTPVMQNVSKYPWNDYDRQEMRYAEKRCQEIYGKDGECLTLFRKFGKRDYTVLCGAKR